MIQGSARLDVTVAQPHISPCSNVDTDREQAHLLEFFRHRFEADSIDSDIDRSNKL
jgi:hypothetical protein